VTIDDFLDTEIDALVAGVNVSQISGDTAAADALELAYDSTAGAVPELGITDRGTAQSATATTLVLRAATPFGSDDANVGSTLWAYGSTQGYWQSETITAYVTATDTATVDTWDVTPSGTITYQIFGTAPGAAGSLTAAAIVDEFETQSQADPTGFHVNVKEVNGTAQTANDIGADANNILADTDEIQISLAAGGLIESMVDDLQSEVDGIQADTEDLQSRTPAALVGGRMDSNIGAATDGALVVADFNADVILTPAEAQTAAAAALDAEDGANFTAIPKTALYDYIEQFACDSGDADTCVDSGLGEADGFWRGVALRSLSGTTAGMERCVTASDQSSTDVTVTPPFPASLGTGTVQLVASALCAGVDPTYTP
jgi:hypothetical protein